MAGDKVVIVYAHSSRQLAKVAGVTANTIIVNGVKYDNKTGRRKGATRYHSSRLSLGLQDFLAIRRQELVQKLAGLADSRCLPSVADVESYLADLRQYYEDAQ
jgi:2-methylisocitrate lyase-like PEP mutase family enzyme